jgi:hypothetical protein
MADDDARPTALPQGKRNPRTTSTRTSPSSWNDVNEYEEPGKGGQQKTTQVGGLHVNGSPHLRMERMHGGK